MLKDENNFDHIKIHIKPCSELNCQNIFSVVYKISRVNNIDKNMKWNLHMNNIVS